MNFLFRYYSLLFGARAPFPSEGRKGEREGVCARTKEIGKKIKMKNSQLLIRLWNKFHSLTMCSSYSHQICTSYNYNWYKFGADPKDQIGSADRDIKNV
jgi:hypothetical protein